MGKLPEQPPNSLYFLFACNCAGLEVDWQYELPLAIGSRQSTAAGFPWDSGDNQAATSASRTDVLRLPLAFFRIKLGKTRYNKR